MSQRQCPAWERCLWYWQQLGVSGGINGCMSVVQDERLRLALLSMPGGKHRVLQVQSSWHKQLLLTRSRSGMFLHSLGGGEPGAAREVGEEFLP